MAKVNYDELVAESNARPINILSRMVANGVLQVKPGTEGATEVGFFSIVADPENPVSAGDLVSAIKAAEKGHYADVSVARLKLGPSYIELGAWIGDQGIALCLMGLGAILELWDIITPRTMGSTDEDQIRDLMGRGFVMIAPKAGSPLFA